MHLGDWTQWWRWQPGAQWRAPQGPGRAWEEIADHPVVHVGWEDATAYARWAGKDLATEAEWEHAARGGLVGRDYGWDAAYADELSPGGAVLADTWQGPFPWRSEDPDGHHRTAPVGSYPANGHGLHDMIGNVWEWTATPLDRRPTTRRASRCRPRRRRARAAAAACAWSRPTGSSRRAGHTCARRTTASATAPRPGRATASTTRRLTSGSGAYGGRDADAAVATVRPRPVRTRPRRRCSAGCGSGW